MKNSRTETKEIESYLHGNLPTGEKLLFKAKILLDPVLRTNVFFQKKTYALVQQYGRRKMKQDLEKAHQNLFRDPTKTAFQNEINNLFTNF